LREIHVESGIQARLEMIRKCSRAKNSMKMNEFSLDTRGKKFDKVSERLHLLRTCL